MALERDLTKVISILYKSTLRQTSLGRESNPGHLFIHRLIKFIWAPRHVIYTAVLIGWDETPQLPPSPRIWTRITRALLVSKDGRHLFYNPLPTSQESTLAKSSSNSLYSCYSEPLHGCPSACGRYSLHRINNTWINSGSASSFVG